MIESCIVHTDDLTMEEKDNEKIYNRVSGCRTGGM